MAPAGNQIVAPVGSALTNGRDERNETGVSPPSSLDWHWLHLPSVRNIEFIYTGEMSGAREIGSQYMFGGVVVARANALVVGCARHLFALEIKRWATENIA